MCPPDRLSETFINAGGDMLLFPTEEDFDYLMDAINAGRLSEERLRDAVSHIIALKIKARLFENQEKIAEEIKISEDIEALSNEIAEKSITVIRNSQNLIPLSIKKGGKFLLINLRANEDDTVGPMYMSDIKYLAEELEKRGYTADTLKVKNHYEVNKIKHNYDCILINCRMDPFSYLGGTLRINWNNIMTFWRGAAVDHPCVIFTSFGDPYKLYELPFLSTYINAYSAAKESLKAVVKVILGEIPAVGKSPVELKGFFEREV